MAKRANKSRGGASANGTGGDRKAPVRVGPPGPVGYVTDAEINAEFELAKASRGATNSGPKREYGRKLKTPRPPSQAAAERLAKRKTDRAEAINAAGEQPLAFEATLAYAFRSIGGKSAAIEYARLVAQDDQRFRRLLGAYDSLSESDKASITLEALCAAGDIRPFEFLGQVVATAHRYNIDVANLVAAVRHPEVVDATIRAALTERGTQDRLMLHQHANFVPLSKGMSVTFNNNNTPQAIAIAAAKADNIATTSIQSKLPTFETVMKGAIEPIRKAADEDPKLLSAPIDAEFVDFPLIGREVEQVVVQEPDVSSDDYLPEDSESLPEPNRDDA